MSSPSEDQTPRVRVGLRLSDFSSTRTVIAGQCCCCCCCLHWIGALAGGAVGLAAADRDGKALPVTGAQHEISLRLHACAWLGLIAVIIAGTLSSYDDKETKVREIFVLLLLVLPAFAPAVVFLYVGLFMLLPALWWRGDNGRYARRLSWRKTWTAFVYATLGSVLGYLAMGAIALLL